MRGKRVVLSAVAGALCCLLAGCPLVETGPEQPEAADAYEAAEHFLSALQTGDYDTAMLYLEEGDDLLYILPAAQEGAESVPLMDPVYRQFCQQLGEMTYSVSEEDTGLFDTVNRVYKKRTFTGPMEITSLVGNISEKDGEPYLHFHINVCDEENRIWGGHLNECLISATGEITVTEIEGSVEREMSEEIGLNLYRF